MKTKQIPSIIMLLAGAVSAIAMYVKHYELKVLLSVLLAVLLVSYIAGLIIKKILDKFIVPALEEETEEGEVIEKEAAETAEGKADDGQNTAEKEP